MMVPMIVGDEVGEVGRMLRFRRMVLPSIVLNIVSRVKQSAISFTSIVLVPQRLPSASESWEHGSDIRLRDLNAYLSIN